MVLEDKRTLTVGDLEIEIGFDATERVAAAYFARTSGWRERLTVAEIATALRNAGKWGSLREALTILTRGWTR